MKRFQGGLVFKAHKLLYYPTLGLIVTKKKKKKYGRDSHEICFPVTVDSSSVSRYENHLMESDLN